MIAAPQWCQVLNGSRIKHHRLRRGVSTRCRDILEHFGTFLTRYISRREHVRCSTNLRPSTGSGSPAPPETHLPPGGTAKDHFHHSRVSPLNLGEPPPP